ncbi:MAG: EamA family transporter [Oligosphaeraceae bacterium]
MDYSGLAAGFLTAILSSSAFLASTWALRRTKGLSPHGLMINAGVLMGILSLGMLAVFWTPALFTRGFVSRLPALAGASVFFSLGQTCVFVAQRKVEASRVVPLLGLKLPMLALISLVFLHDPLGPWQFLAIFLAVAAAFLLNHAGKSIPLASILFVLGGCLSYCISDLSLNALTRRIAADLGESTLMAALHCTALTYIGVAVLALAALCFTRASLTTPAVLRSIPFSCLWIGCIIALNFCFARLGTVHGTLLQNTRGIFTLLLTPLCIAMGCTALETKLTANLFWRRMAAAALVFLAVFVYQLGK